MATIIRITADEPGLLTPAEAGRVFRVDPKSVARWAREGKLPCVKTLGGHRRYKAADLERLLNDRARAR